MKQLTELRDTMRAKNYFENAKVIDAAIERIGELEKEVEFFRDGFCNAISGLNIETTLKIRDLEQRAKGVEDVLNEWRNCSDSNVRVNLKFYADQLRQKAQELKSG